jgi:hypothetical protein
MAGSGIPARMPWMVSAWLVDRMFAVLAGERDA